MKYIFFKILLIIFGFIAVSNINSVNIFANTFYSSNSGQTKDNIVFSYNNRGLIGVSSLISRNSICNDSGSNKGKILEISSVGQENFPTTVKVEIQGKNYTLAFEPELLARTPIAFRKIFTDFILSNKLFILAYETCKYSKRTKDEIFISGIFLANQTELPDTPSGGNTLPTEACKPISLGLSGFKANLQIKKRTIQEFTKYHLDKQRINKLKNISDSEYHTLRFSALQKLNLQGVDEDFIEFIESIKNRQSKLSTLYQEVEAYFAANNLARQLNEEQNSEIPEETGGQLVGELTNIITSPMFDSMDSTYKNRFLPGILKTEIENINRENFLLARLNVKYAHNFYTIVNEEPLKLLSKTAVEPKTTCKSNSTEVEFRVETLVRTGIKVCKGDRITFLADGLLSLGTFAPSSAPDGVKFSPLYNVVENLPHGALLYSLTNKGGKEIFEKVNFGGSLTSLSSGELTFLINDKDYKNNRGYYRVKVSIECPEIYVNDK